MDERSRLRDELLAGRVKLAGIALLGVGCFQLFLGVSLFLAPQPPAGVSVQTFSITSGLTLVEGLLGLIAGIGTLLSRRRFAYGGYLLSLFGLFVVAGSLNLFSIGLRGLIVFLIWRGAQALDVLSNGSVAAFDEEGTL